MRILHFMTSPVSIEEIRSGGKGIKSGGGWMAALIGQLLKDPGMTVACAAFGVTDKVQISTGARIDSFLLPQRHSDKEEGLRICCDVVKRWKPDLLHIHGTEGLFGLLPARQMVDCGAVISLQGLMGPYAEWHHFFGNRSIRDIVSMIRFWEICTNRGLWGGFRQIRRYAARESEIIRGNRFIMGRTQWDRSYIRALNPSAKYYLAGELLREPFWRKRWSIETVQRHRLVFTNAKHPRKGTEILLDAVRLLKPDYPDMQVCIAGNIPARSGYGKYLLRHLQALGNCVVELGSLDADHMAEELMKSHVFVSPSFIDNSPNAVCEAQLVGMPVVSTYVGGVSSLVTDRLTGLFCNAGDAFMLAARIREVFEDDDLAVRLGRQAREVAVLRHDPDVITNELLGIYEDVLRRSNVLQQKPIPVPA
jgi:glycosyltransferase involved in cell wall biosynthesis